jgi:type 1 glutamine amidotransferase
LNSIGRRRRDSGLDRRFREFYESGEAVKKLSFPMRGLLTVLLLGAPAVGAAVLETPATIVLISGEYEYDSARTLPAFRSYLSTNYPFRCVCLERTRGEDIPGLDALDKADLAVVFIRRMTLPEEQLGRIRKYVASGRPLIGLRTASHAFENWRDWDRDVLGGNYQNHYANDLVATIRVRPEAVDHPILKGVEGEFVAGGSLYRNAPLPTGSLALLTGSVNGHPPEPVAWTHSVGTARVFYTSLGHPKDFENPSFRRLLVNAIFWALDRPAPDGPKGSSPARPATEKKSD